MNIHDPVQTRRAALQALASLGAGVPIASLSAATSAANKIEWRMPDESAPHQRTWMAFGASKAIWGSRLLAEVQRNLATIALAIAKYEPVSMLVREADMPLAAQLLGNKVELIVCPHDDIWIRDTGPVFLVSANGGKAAADFNFNGWGEKQDYARDAHVANFVSKRSGALEIQSHLTLEGGAIEVDGQGTAIITESCVLNQNRNPGVSKAQCEKELKRILGLEKIIWLPGVKGKDITDGHTDFYARFARPGVVFAGYDADPNSFDHAVTKRHLRLLRTATDAKGNKLEVIALEAPRKVRTKFATADSANGYINFYVCNGAVIAPEFGDARADSAALRALQHAFPGREIVQLNIDAIAGGGGGIHCTTQQEPRV
jgi:agmatine deiminase